jgi:hypothetical protein
MPKKTTTKKAVTDPPNVRFTLTGTTPPERINTPRGVIELPDADTQKAGFRHERAAELIAMFPHWYKKPTNKGEN